MIRKSRTHLLADKFTRVGPTSQVELSMWEIRTYDSIAMKRNH